MLLVRRVVGLLSWRFKPEGLMQHQREKIMRMRDGIWKIGNNMIIFPLLSSPNRIKRHILHKWKACQKLYKHPLKCYFSGIIRLSSMKVSNATDQTDFFIKCMAEALRDSSRRVSGMRGSNTMRSKQGQSVSWWMAAAEPRWRDQTPSKLIHPS